MAVKPIIFHWQKVQDIVKYKKTRTRRYFFNSCPYAKNDSLYVLEDFAIRRKDASVLYRANESSHPLEYLGIDRWENAQHMPKALARIHLLVTDVRKERVLGVTERAAQMEGYNDRAAFLKYWEIKLKGTTSVRNNPYLHVIDFEYLPF